MAFHSAQTQASVFERPILWAPPKRAIDLLHWMKNASSCANGCLLSRDRTRTRAWHPACRRKIWLLQT
ncbi:hypothetical protein TKWG_15290 [Advenella kashmirensis WT001]|uniref:Uncharacterized protein n=1 Tax=Advenella kashmirensis (strain DSM 17095 / LMG 22695 / WT001) TaxID=1036672 RepID=I3UDI2_ADVKW|nr:hypothetical protein TKWG_15290 [Advenella kashmirensis WT001]